MVPLLLAIAAALASSVLWWPAWRSIGWARRCAVALVALASAITAALGGAHLVAVAAQLPGKVYDFRAYALLLLGVALIVPALVGAATVPGLLSGQRRARRTALATNLWLLMINAALIPMQGFAMLLTVAAAVACLTLAALSRGATQLPSSGFASQPRSSTHL